jgi:hypothetical protein
VKSLEAGGGTRVSPPLTARGSNDSNTDGNALVTEPTSNAAEDMSTKLKEKKNLDDNDIRSVMLALVHRKRFIYSKEDILKYLLQCMCCRDIDRGRHRKSIKKHFFF